MPSWTCAIGGCAASFDDLEALIAHQVEGHDSHRCQVCEEIVPEGFFAIRHMVEDHSRAEYVRHYDADADDIRHRESLVDAISSTLDVDALHRRLESDGGDEATVGAAE